MHANYGYRDATGDYFITIDTDRCDGCGDCVKACPVQVFVIEDEDPNDPLRDIPVVVVADDKNKKLKYECGSCKSSGGQVSLPCIEACNVDAISHSW